MTSKVNPEKSISLLSRQDLRRRKREVFLIGVILVVVALLTYAENRITHLGSDFPVSNTILMFVLINFNLLLLILLIYLVFRNVVKLLYDRKRKVMGSRLRTRLVAAFVALSLLPTIVLFFFSINFITSSIEFWFNAPVEQALENSLEVGRRFYSQLEENNRFFLEKIAYQLENRNLLKKENIKDLHHYVQVTRQSLHLNGIEIYTSNSNRLSFSVSEDIHPESLVSVSANNLQKEAGLQKVRSVSMTIKDGELFRTIGTVPFGATRSETRAFLVVTLLIPPDINESMSFISKGFEEYQQIKLLKEPIRITYYITLSIVALLVVFCAVWFGFYLAKSISIPIMELAEGARSVSEGNLEVEIEPVGDDEIGSLVNAFNRMTRDLRNGRHQLEVSARMLRNQNVEIEKRRRFMEIVLKNVSTGVIAINAKGHIATINKSAEKMLQIKSDRLLNKSFRRLLKGQNITLVREILADLRGAGNNSIELPLKMVINGKPKSFLININTLKDDTGQRIGYVVVFDDLTELEKAQRMAAWREVARRIAHEVKNPLTPITLSAQRLRRKYSNLLESPVFNDCTRTIIDHVTLIRNLVNEFSSFARFPTANPEPTQLQTIIEETFSLYRESHFNIRFELKVDGDIPALNLDVQQFKQAIINLLENAVAAIKGSGAVVITVTHDPILKRVRLEVTDNGIGISNEDKTRLFEPNFSTKKSGMGLGLTIVSSIISDHNGLISVQDNKPKGAKFVIELPV
jgi:two-component system nitrogen regulation sensor histidine kinase NtrY